MKEDIMVKDYLEIYDMDFEELNKYTKKQLIRLIGQLTHELYEMESSD